MDIGRAKVFGNLIAELVNSLPKLILRNEHFQIAAFVLDGNLPCFVCVLTSKVILD